MTASVAYCIYATDCGYGFVLEYKVLHLENKQLKTNNNMKKIFNWVLAAILVCGASVVMSSCSKDDDSDNSSTPQSKKYDVYASAVLDKNLAEYGYMEVSYTCNGKTETFQLKKGDASEQFPTNNDFGNSVLKYVNSMYQISYTNDNFIVRNIVLKGLTENESAVFKYKFVANPDHPAITEDGNRFFVKPNVLGYVDGYYTQILYNLVGSSVKTDRFDSWLTSQGNEMQVTFSPKHSE